jgi:hypothetical protein
MAVKNAQLDKAEAAFAAIEQVSMNLVHFNERAFKRSPLLGVFFILHHKCSDFLSLQWKHSSS